MKAIVLLNVSTDMFFGYKPETSVLHHAHTFEMEEGRWSPHILEDVWAITNQYPDEPMVSNVAFFEHYKPQMEAYRYRSNRSLSIGDVVVLMRGEDATAWAVATMGFDQVEVPTNIDLSDLDNHLEESLAWKAHAKFFSKIMERS